MENPSTSQVAPLSQAFPFPLSSKAKVNSPASGGSTCISASKRLIIRSCSPMSWPSDATKSDRAFGMILVLHHVTPCYTNQVGGAIRIWGHILNAYECKWMHMICIRKWHWCRGVCNHERHHVSVFVLHKWLEVQLRRPRGKKHAPLIYDELWHGKPIPAGTLSKETWETEKKTAWAEVGALMGNLIVI